MKRYTNRKTITGIFFGILITALGVILAGNAAGIWDIDLFFRGWWTLFIIIPCLYVMIADGPDTGNVIGLLVGVLLLLSHIDPISKYVTWRLIFPIIIIIIGVKIIISAFDKRNWNYREKNSFRERKLNYSGKTFVGGDFKCSFGTLVMDMSSATINQNEPYRLNCSFGRIEILLPAGLSLDVKTSENFAEIRNTYPDNNVGIPLSIEICCSFGSIVIKEKNA